MCQAVTPRSGQLRRERTLRDCSDDDTDAKETLRGLYDQPAEAAPGYLDDLIDSLLEPNMAPELRQLGRTLRTWRTKICALHRAQVSNGPTKATNNLIKVIKRIGFGFRRFRNHRLRVLLYAGHPSWDLLAAITPAPPPP
jgi:transposase